MPRKRLRKNKSQPVTKRTNLRRPKRKPADELTVAKRYTSIPASAVAEIRKASTLYGSHGRALQVSTEILIRMRKRPLLPPQSYSVVTKMTYKLLPRTAGL